MNIDARFPRSKETRARILSAARRLFSSVGYERTTIRAVAVDAEIDASMVMRYYGSKEGLFAAAVVFETGFPDLKAVPRRKVGEAVIRHFLEAWEEPGTRESLPALLRTASSNPAALRRLRTIFNKEARAAIGEVCNPERQDEAVALTVSQILGIAYSRYVLKIQPMARLKPDAIVNQVGPTLQRYICG